MRPIDSILADIKKFKDLCEIFEKHRKAIQMFCQDNNIEFFFHQHLTSKEFHEFVNGNLSLLRNELAKARDE